MTSIKDWPIDTTPRHKLLQRSSTSISIAELLSVLIRNGTPQHNAVEIGLRLLDHFQHNLNKLANASPEELMQIKGIGRKKAAAILAAIEFGHRVLTEPPPERNFIRNSLDAYNYLADRTSNFDKPGLAIFYLKQSGWVAELGLFTPLSCDYLFPDPKFILRNALHHTAVSIVTADLCLQKARISWEYFIKLDRLNSACNSIDIKLLDHMLVKSPSDPRCPRYFSFSDENLLDFRRPLDFEVPFALRSVVASFARPVVPPVSSIDSSPKSPGGPG